MDRLCNMHSFYKIMNKTTQGKMKYDTDNIKYVYLQ